MFRLILQRFRWETGFRLMSQTVHYFVRVTQRGQSNGRFGWEICRQDDSLVVQRSTRTFPTLAQALLASTAAASSLALGLTVDSLSLRRQKRSPPSLPRQCNQGEETTRPPG
jgi:hypothetical protein